MRYLVILVGLAGFLSACGSNTSVSNSGSILPENTNQLAVINQTQTAPNIENPISAASAPVAVAKPRVLLEPEIMIGRSATEVREVFGTPTLQRVDKPAEVWQYLATDCALHLFFYPNGSNRQLTVSHISINGRNVTTDQNLDPKLCFNNHIREIGAEDDLVTSEAS